MFHNKEKIPYFFKKPMLWVHAEAILMSTHSIGFYEEMAKIIFQLSSNEPPNEKTNILHMPEQRPRSASR